MPGSTTPDNIYYPVIGDVAGPRLQMTALADSVQAALSGLRLYDRPDRVTNFLGAAADIGTVTPKDGDTYRETDGNKLLWQRTGGVWVTGENGMYLIRPGTVTNGVINADGSVSPTGATTASVSLNNIFTTRFRSFKIVMFVGFVNVSAPAIYFRAAGTDNTSTNYFVSKLYFTGGASTAGVSENVSTRLEPSPAVCLVHTVECVLTHPAHNTSGQSKMAIGTAGGIGTNSYTSTWRSSYQTDTVAFDGFTLAGYAGGGTQYLEPRTWIKVYGLA